MFNLNNFVLGNTELLRTIFFGFIFLYVLIYYFTINQCVLFISRFYQVLINALNLQKILHAAIIRRNPRYPTRLKSVSLFLF